MISLLPIGSVVTLKEGTKKLMVYGRAQFNLEDNRVYDYLGCLYPEGNIGEEFNYLFNHEDIEVINYVGFVDSEEQAYLRELIDNIEKSTK